MHTIELKSCRIHYSGEFIITNKDTTSKAIGAESEIKITMEDLKSFYKEVKEGDTTVVLKREGSEITILLSDLDEFLRFYMKSILESLIETSTLSISTYEQMQSIF